MVHMYHVQVFSNNCGTDSVGSISSKLLRTWELNCLKGEARVLHLQHVDKGRGTDEAEAAF